MSFRRAVAWNLVVQSIGPVSAFLTVFVVARLGGPADQGRYAQTKAWVDLVFAIGCFGFPQSFVFVIKRLGASASTLARWSGVYAAGLLPLALVSSTAAVALGVLGGSVPPTPITIAAISMAASLLVAHGLWRGVYLTYDAGVRFAVFTILPAVFLFLGVAVAMTMGWRRFELAILASSFAAAVAGHAMIRPIRTQPVRPVRELPLHALLTNGLHAFLQAMLVTVQPLIAYALIRSHGGTDRDVGFFNVGLFLSQGMIVPVSMVAPVLFVRWAAVPDDSVLARLNAFTGRALLVGAVGGALIAAVSGAVVVPVFGAEYVAAIVPVQVVLASLPIACHARIVQPALHARGRPGINTGAGAARLVVFTSAMLILAERGPTLSAAVAWTLAELAAATWVLIGLRASSVGAQPLTPECT